MADKKITKLEISPELQEWSNKWKNRDAPAGSFDFIIPHIRRDVGQAVREAREAKNFSQKDLAEKLGTRQAFISDLEKGKTEPNVSLLIQLSYYLDQSVMYFIPSSYREFFGAHPTDREELSPEEEEVIRRMRDVYPVLNRGLILHLLRSILDYDEKVMDWMTNK